MNAQFEIEDFSDIEMTLASYSDGAHVDRVEYWFSRDSMEAIAVFRCDHFGDCIVSMQLSDETKITEADLATMATLANAKLERVVCDSGCGAVFNIVKINTAEAVPTGFTIKYIELN